jgi:hypothetical protein
MAAEREVYFTVATSMVIAALLFFPFFLSLLA